MIIVKNINIFLCILYNHIFTSPEFYVIVCAFSFLFLNLFYENCFADCPAFMAALSAIFCKITKQKNNPGKLQNLQRSAFHRIVLFFRISGPESALMASPELFQLFLLCRFAKYQLVRQRGFLPTRLLPQHFQELPAGIAHQRLCIKFDTGNGRHTGFHERAVIKAGYLNPFRRRNLHFP